MSTEIEVDGEQSRWGSPRSRTVNWHDPAPVTAAGMSMTGLEYLQAMESGLLPAPPSAELLRMNMVTAERGHVVVSCEPDESMYNATGLIHGGVVCTVLDTVAGCAVLSTLPRGRAQASIEIKVNYLKAVRLDSGILTAEGTVKKVGSRLGFAEGVVTDASGAVVATASSTLLIMDL